MIQDEQELQKALDQDPALRKRIEDNKAQAIANGAVQVVSPELADKVRRAKVLQAELAGYKQLSTEAKTNPNVVATINPKIHEYINLRAELAVLETLRILGYELGVEDGKLRAVMEVAQQNSLAQPAAVTAPTQTSERTEMIARMQKMVGRSMALAEEGKYDEAEKLCGLAERLAKLI